MTSAVKKEKPNYLFDSILKEKRKYKIKNSLPSGWDVVSTEEYIQPTPEEKAALFDILTSANVIYKPRPNKVYQDNGIDPHKWEALGFEDQNHYQNWCVYNGLKYEKIEEEEFIEIIDSIIGK